MATEAIQGKPSTTSEAAPSGATLQKPWNFNIAKENLFECSPTVLEAIASGKVQEACPRAKCKKIVKARFALPSFLVHFTSFLMFPQGVF